MVSGPPGKGLLIVSQYPTTKGKPTGNLACTVPGHIKEILDEDIITTDARGYSLPFSPDQNNGGEENHFVVCVVYCMLDASTEHYNVYYIDSTWHD